MKQKRLGEITLQGAIGKSIILLICKNLHNLIATNLFRILGAPILFL